MAEEKKAIDDAIKIVVTAMNEIENAKGKYWYLPYLQMERVWIQLCREKYFPDQVAEFYYKSETKKPLKIPTDWDTEDTAILEM